MLQDGSAFPLAALAVGATGGALLVTPAQAAVHGATRFGIPARILSALAGAAAFWLTAVRLGPTPHALPVLLLLTGGIVLSLVDIAEKRLPNRVLLITAGIVAAGLGVSTAVQGDWWRLVPATLGALAMFGIYFTLALSSPGGIGMGDVKLAALLGLVLGYLGWSSWLIGLLAGFVAGSAVSLTALALHRASRSSLLPFGPSMLAGAVVAIALS